MSVPHDGTLTTLAGHNLDEFNTKPRDIAAGIIALDTFSAFKTFTGEDLAMVIQLIRRKNIHPEVFEYFNSTNIDILRKLSQRFEQEVLHIDLHGFSAQPIFGKYDLILGTGHRLTVGESTLDRYFGDFMSRRGYEVYVPTEAPVDGELWTAEAERTMVQKVKKADIPKVASIQIEVSPKFRHKGQIQEGLDLSRNIASFIKEVQVDLPYLL